MTNVAALEALMELRWRDGPPTKAGRYEVKYSHRLPAGELIEGNCGACRLKMLERVSLDNGMVEDAYTTIVRHFGPIPEPGE